MKKHSILKDIRIMILILIVIFGTGLLVLDIYSTVSSFNARKKNINSTFLKSKQNLIKQEVENIVEIINYSIQENELSIREKLKNNCENLYKIIDQIQSKYSEHYTQKEIKDIVFNIIKEYRFENNIGYYFITDNKGFGVFHPEVEDYPGVSLLELLDSKGRKTVYEVLNKLKKKDGVFHDFYLYDDVRKKNRLKPAYFKEYKLFDWIIGSTFYHDEYDSLIKDRLFKRIGSIRFDNNPKNYIFLMSFEGTVLVNNVQRELVGKNIWNMEDPDGLKVVQEEKKLAEKKEGGFLQYKWKNPVSGIIEPKLSFIKGIPEWEWILGAGIYLDDINIHIENLYKDLFDSLKIKVFYDSVFLSGVFLLIYYFLQKTYIKAEKSKIILMNDIESAILNNQFLDIDSKEYDEIKNFKLFFNKIMLDKQKFQMELEDQRKRFEKIIEGTRVGTWAWNIQTGDVVFNEKWANILGYKLQELTPYNIDTWKNLSHPEDFKIAEQKLTEHLEGKSDCYEIDMRMKHKDGRWIWINDSGKILKYDENGKPLMAYGSHSDITEKKQFEESLKKTKAYITDIINSMPSIIIGIDKDTNVTQWNKTAAEFTGIDIEHAIGKNLYDVFFQLKEENDLIALSLKQNKINSVKKNFVFKEQKNAVFDITVYPLKEHGNSGAVIRIDDITESTNMQSIIMQTEKMLSVGGLAAGMAHEINNPLSGIIQSIQNVFRRIDPENTKNVEVGRDFGVDLLKMNKYMEKRNVLGFLNGIKDSGERAAAIVYNMLQFSRISSEILTEIDIMKILDDTLDLASSDYDLKKKYDFKHIKIIKDYGHDMKKVFGNIQQLEQVFFNLFKNAAFEMAVSNREEPIISINTRLENNGIRIEISDNGPGMDENAKKRAFDPFYTTKGVGEGTGLGLSVSYFIIVDKHKGKIWIEDSEYGGAKFVIVLPVVNSEK